MQCTFKFFLLDVYFYFVRFFYENVYNLNIIDIILIYFAK